jgi:hypothetical protein
MWLAVSGEKTLQAQEVRMAGASDDNRPAYAARPHDLLGEFSLLDHQAIGLHPTPDKRCPSRSSPAQQSS